MDFNLTTFAPSTANKLAMARSTPGMAATRFSCFPMTIAPGILRRPDLPPKPAAAEPLFEPRRAEAGVVAGREAPIVHRDAGKAPGHHHRSGVAVRPYLGRARPWDQLGARYLTMPSTGSPRCPPE